MKFTKPTILTAFVLAFGAPLSASATTVPDEPKQTEIEVPDARILSLSPDGQLLAVRKPIGGQTSELCVYEVASQAERACADLEGPRISMADDQVAWSPDSTQIAFGEDALRTFLDGDLWVMDASNGELTNLTDDGFEGRLPVLDGDDEQPDDPVHIDVLPAWAPDSRSIAFSRSSIVDGEWTGNEIAGVDLDGGDVESLTRVSTDRPGVVYWGLTWAPDGQRLLYSVSDPDNDHPDNGVWEFDEATGETRHIVPTDPVNGPPALVRVSATGTTGLVMFPLKLSQQAVHGGIYALLDLESNALSALEPPEPDPTAAAFVSVATFSPDGTQVLFGVTEDASSQLFVRDVPDGLRAIEAAALDARPMTTTFGGGLFWGSDGTVFVAIEVGVGVLLDFGADS